MKKTERAQSLLEIALLFPVLLVLLSGLVEFGFLFNQYLAVLDSVRNSARFASDKYFRSNDEIHNCDANNPPVTTDFYRQAACVALLELAQEKPGINFNVNNGDDIIVSVYSLTQYGGVVARYPNNVGWSYALDLPGYNHREQVSRFSIADVNAKLNPDSPNTGLVSVEIFYHYYQVLNLPWLSPPFLVNPVLLHVFAFMPQATAEP